MDAKYIYKFQKMIFIPYMILLIVVGVGKLQVENEILEAIGRFVGGAALIADGLFLAINPSGAIEFVRSNRPPILDIFFPKKGDELVVAVMGAGGLILGIILFTFGGVIPLSYLLKK